MYSVAVCRQLRARLALAASTLLFAAGCGDHYVTRGSALYADGHYVEAAEVFERTEDRLARSSGRERARFGLYRGATFLKLGDLEHAARWLGYARSVANSDAEALSPDELAFLGVSLEAIGRGGLHAPERKDDSTVAAAPPAAEAKPQTN